MRPGASGMPFAILRGYSGTGLEGLPGLDGQPAVRPITCPFTGERLTAVAALNPDVAVIHAQRADRAGNVQLWGITGVQKEAVLGAQRSVVTVEEIVDQLDPQPGAIVLPTWAVDYVAEAPGRTRIRPTRSATPPGTTTTTRPGTRSAGTGTGSASGWPTRCSAGAGSPARDRHARAGPAPAGAAAHLYRGRDDDRVRGPGADATG